MLNKNKLNIIIELLVKEYGEKERERITEKVKDTYFDLSSTQNNEYSYLLNNYEKVSEKSKKKITDNYLEYKEATTNYKKENKKSLYNLIVNLFNIENPPVDDKDIEDFNGLFSGKRTFFGPSCIDVYKKPKDTEKTLLQKKQFLERLKELGVTSIDLSEENITDFIRYRSYFVELFINNNDMKFAPYKKLSANIRLKFNGTLNPNNIKKIYNTINPTFFFIKENDTSFKIIKLPLLQEKKNKSKHIDQSLIHEIIHRVEANELGHVGLSTENYNIFNEVRTELMSMKIADNLHKHNVFIFDKEQTKKNESLSTYKIMFPFIQKFIEKNNDLLNEAAINNDHNSMTKKFGDEWNYLLEYTDLAYKSLLQEKYFGEEQTMSSKCNQTVLYNLTNSLLHKGKVKAKTYEEIKPKITK